LSWEDISQEVADGWGITYQEAFTLVSFIARKLRSGGQTRSFRSRGESPSYRSQRMAREGLEDSGYRTFTERDRDRE